MGNDLALDLNLVSRFLARNDVEANSKIHPGEWIVLVGSSLPTSCEFAAQLFRQRSAQKILVCGGVGHSTSDLWQNVAKHPIYKDIPVENRPESEIFRDLLVNHLSIDPGRVVIENKSTNCGANAIESRRTLDQFGENPSHLTIVQDPTMQRRTHASFERAWADRPETTFVSAVPFVPEVTHDAEGCLVFISPLPDSWSMERFVSLLLGEVTRLTDDENGYGPQGKNFIDHVDVPPEVIAAAGRIRPHFPQLVR